MAETADAPPSPFPRTFPHIAALASWISPLVGLFLGNFARRATGALVWQRLTLPFIALGIALALYGLWSIRKHGSKGLLVNAMVGFIVNGSLVLVFALIFKSGRL
jgi:hypothetical protein